MDLPVLRTIPFFCSGMDSPVNESMFAQEWTRLHGQPGAARDGRRDRQPDRRGENIMPPLQAMRGHNNIRNFIDLQ